MVIVGLLDLVFEGKEVNSILHAYLILHCPFFMPCLLQKKGPVPNSINRCEFCILPRIMRQPSRGLTTVLARVGNNIEIGKMKKKMT